jgi:hypothetical protein
MPRQTTYVGLQVQVGKAPDGGRALIFTEPATGDSHLFPLEAAIARDIGNQLFSAVEIATEMPAPVRPPNGRPV